ncbi:Oplophorus-luciferin 2-monooxygenase non-catalytic subunit [Penaeus vannamei]|uniref:Oplophorus-luciferin 2-monooxygenase non-catalytic subunit n=1 Tax=Penaeus vannamei TaxID=6689 RepID=A0A423TIU4_PENVA|nr:Oplophorus-luciferin 2-monooxygenase non-catalytic subunit [Penaeus vannamei]
MRTVSLPPGLVRASRKVNMKKFAHLGLLSLLITFCHGRFLTFPKLPCPIPEDILPCTCTGDENGTMDMDCSHVVSEDELERVFSSFFPYTMFRNFTVVDNTYLKTLRNQALGIASFTGVYIMNSVLEVVEPDALSSSFATARVVNMQNNSISSFPFETLPSFTSLLELGLSDNSLTFPALESETLLMLDLSNNQIQNVAATAFLDVPEISEIYLGGNQISHIPTGTFAGHYNLHIVNLESNSLTYLPEGAIQLTSISPGTVNLRRNQITDIAVNSIIEVGNLDMSNNNLTVLEEHIFRPLLSQGTILEIQGNPLTCD